MSIRPLNLIGTILIVAIGSSLFAPPRLCGQASPKQPTSNQQLKEVVPAPVPEFAVATVKSARGNGMSLLQLTPDGIRIENFSLQDILRAAFGVQDDRISGSPDWTKAERFDIEAKVDDSDVAKLGALTIDKRRAMLLPLLVDRFDLKFHCEQRDLSTYTLVIAKGGSKLKESNAELAQRHFQPVGRGQLESIGTPLKYLVPILSRQLGRTVFDKTGLTGLYDYTLQWPPDDRAGPFSNGSNGDGDSASKPDLLTALREQLGLSLESQKGPVEVAVVDHMSKPNAN
jgi:uncharacterized protein (TIGR03435 family)